jgi:Right handed beta helix region
MKYSVGGGLGLLSVWLVFGSEASADARGTERECRLIRAGSTLVLASDCTTRASLVIPDGFTFDGRGHTVRARDPEGGAFSGAVVRSGGRVAHLRNVTIVAEGLDPTCHTASPVDERLRGVLFENTSGSITSVRVRGVSQSPMACQEGHGIDVRTTGERTGASEERVLVAGCSVEGFQKTGILVVGAVEVGLYANRVLGGGPLAEIAQNGIQLARGAHGSAKLNRVAHVGYAGSDWTAVGLLAQDAGPLDLALNAFDDTDVAIWLERTSASEVHGNRVTDSVDALVIDGRSGAASDVSVHHNRFDASDVGVLLLGAGATGAVVRDNRIEAPSGAVVELLGATGNTLD